MTNIYGIAFRNNPTWYIKDMLADAEQELETVFGEAYRLCEHRIQTIRLELERRGEL